MIDLKFDNVSKRYLVREEESAAGVAGNRLLRKWRNARRGAREFWAVRDVSFEVERGEALGIIGHNGAGKSTILKMLSSITTPTSGEIMINGRLAALIEVGSGFHPELTGRENIFLNGSILGMNRTEIAAKLDDIVDFAGVRQFIDTPVKRYSSGMYVRLGFSIAAHLDPDILLLDEVLAVGDAAFQAKCLDRIGQMRRQGTTIVFISHDLSAVERLCTRALLMRGGKLVASGAPRDVIAEYQRVATHSAAPVATVQSSSAEQPLPPQEARITTVECYDAQGKEKSAFCTGELLAARIAWVARNPVADVVIELLFYSRDGDKLISKFTTELSDRRVDLAAGDGVINFSCAELGLPPDIYVLGASIKRRGAHEDLDWQRYCTTLRVDPNKAASSEFYMPHEWKILQEIGCCAAANVCARFSRKGLRSCLKFRSSYRATTRDNTLTKPLIRCSLKPSAILKSSSSTTARRMNSPTRFSPLTANRKPACCTRTIKDSPPRATTAYAHQAAHTSCRLMPTITSARRIWSKPSPS
jgi:ABC-type polysaccharide/polyol phosphate transport system ATPase subunit